QRQRRSGRDRPPVDLQFDGRPGSHGPGHHAQPRKKQHGQEAGTPLHRIRLLASFFRRVRRNSSPQPGENCHFLALAAPLHEKIAADRKKPKPPSVSAKKKARPYGRACVPGGGAGESHAGSATAVTTVSTGVAYVFLSPWRPPIGRMPAGPARQMSFPLPGSRGKQACKL